MYGGDIWDKTTYRIKGVIDSASNVLATATVKTLFELGSRITNIGPYDSVGMIVFSQLSFF